MNTKHLTNEQIESIEKAKRQTISNIGEAWKTILRQELPDLRGRKVLDAGCGTGFVSILLAMLGAEVTALDQSGTVLQDARAHAEYHLVDKSITFCKADAARSGLPVGSFDAVVSRHVTAMLQEPYETYEEWYRLLKPEGVLLNFDANWLSPLWNEEEARSFLENEQKIKLEDAGYTDLYHDRFVLMKLSQYPLAFRQRPQWDRETCEAIGFRKVETRALPNEGLLPPVLETRFQSIPSFLVRAEK